MAILYHAPCPAGFGCVRGESWLRGSYIRVLGRRIWGVRRVRGDDIASHLPSEDTSWQLELQRVAVRMELARVAGIADRTDDVGDLHPRTAVAHEQRAQFGE